MTSTQCSIRFFLGDPRAIRSTTIYLYFRYYSHSGNEKKRCTIKLPTSYTIHPKDWDKKADKVKPGRAGELNINASLFKIVSDLKTAWAQLNLSNKSISTDQLREIVTGSVMGFQVNDTASTFNNSFDEFINYMKTVERAAPGTISKYSNMHRLLNMFSNYTGRKLSFESIDLNFYEAFMHYLFEVEEPLPEGANGKINRPKEKMKKNTVGKVLKLLKRFLKFSHIRGITDQAHYIRFRSFSEKVEKIALSVSDVKAIESVDLSNYPFLETTRDSFLFACYTGQRFNDVAALQRIDISGRLWKLHDKKTNEIRTAVLLPEALAILDKYKNQILPLSTKANPIVNKEIKEICRLAGINEAIKMTAIDKGEKKTTIKKKYEEVTFHTARRTFVTIAKARGMSYETIKSQTGHKSNSMVDLYDKATPEMIADKIYNEWQKVS